LHVGSARAALYRQIEAEATRLCSDARTRPLLVVDEAHHLRPDVLEDFRLLTNLSRASAAPSLGQRSSTLSVKREKGSVD
jgi:type II secretory pathway predicted ATPase ExeA